MNRRRFLHLLLLAGVTFAGGNRSWFREIAVTPLNPSQIPLLNCSGIAREINWLRGEAARLQADPDQEGRRLAEAYGRFKTQYINQRRDLQVQLRQKRIEQALGTIGLLFSGFCLALGFVVSSPLAIGSLLAAQVLVGTSLLSYQAVVLRPDNKTIFLQYTKDRVSLITSLVDTSSSTVGRILLRSLEFTSLVWDAIQVYMQGRAVSEASAKVLDAQAKLDDVVSRLDRLNNTVQWASIRRRMIENNIEVLQRYERSFRSTDCRADSAFLYFRPTAIPVPSV